MAAAAAAATAAATSASFPRRYDYVEYSAPLVEGRVGGGGGAGAGGAHRQVPVPPQQRDLRAASAGLSSGDMSRSQQSGARGGEAGGAWGGGGGEGGAVPPLAAAERAGHGAVRSAGAGGGGELEYSGGYTARRSTGTSSGHLVTRHNAVRLPRPASGEGEKDGGYMAFCLFYTYIPVLLHNKQCTTEFLVILMESLPTRQPAA